MTIRTYRITLGAPGGATREVTVASPTDVQAADAVRPLMAECESILAIGTGVQSDEAVDAGPPLSQAAELAPVTPGGAAAPPASTTGDPDQDPLDRI